MAKRIFLVFCYLLLFVSLIFYYKKVSRTLPVSYFDEELWVRETYFFQFYSPKTFDRSIWNTNESSNQPKLTEFVYGAWIYPKYLRERKENPGIDYTQFLIKNGFYSAYLPENYLVYKESLKDNFVTLDYSDSDTLPNLVKKYGVEILRNTDLIIYVRQMNIALLILNVTLVTIYFYKLRGIVFGVLFGIFYAYNPLITDSVLRAHSESVFLLMFNLTIIFMFKYFLNNKKMLYLVLFSIFAGLCFSAKLNGVMLLLPYLLIAVFPDRKYDKRWGAKAYLINVLVPILIAWFVFIILNPYTFSSPILNIVKMLEQRLATVQLQIYLFPQAYLPNLADRAGFIFKLLFESVNVFASNPALNNTVNVLTLLSFFGGLFVEVKNVQKGVLVSKVMMLTFCVVMIVTVFYLRLAWARYAAHLVLFYVYYVACGLAVALETAGTYLPSILTCVKIPLLKTERRT